MNLFIHFLDKHMVKVKWPETHQRNKKSNDKNLCYVPNIQVDAIAACFNTAPVNSFFQVLIFYLFMS